MFWGAKKRDKKDLAWIWIRAHFCKIQYCPSLCLNFKHIYIGILVIISVSNCLWNMLHHKLWATMVKYKMATIQLHNSGFQSFQSPYFLISPPNVIYLFRDEKSGPCSNLGQLWQNPIWPPATKLAELSQFLFEF